MGDDVRIQSATRTICARIGIPALMLAILLWPVAASPSAQNAPDAPAPAGSGTAIEAVFTRAVQAGLSVPRKACTNGRAANLFADETGFALAWRPRGGGHVGVNGGANYATYTVENTGDTDATHPYGVPGSLRAQITAAGKAGGGWIIFDPIKGGTITLNKTLYLPSNVTVDGGCQNIKITNAISCGTSGHPSTVCTPENCHNCSQTLFAIIDATNVVVANLQFAPDPRVTFAYDLNVNPATRQPYGVIESGDCMTISSRDPTQEVNGIWIAHNSFTRCHDGLLDITQNNYDFTAAQTFKPTAVTIAFNHFIAPHDKDGGFGTGTCETYNPKTNIPAYCNLDPARHGSTLRAWDPHNGIQVTLQGNLYDLTSARHPRTGGVTYVHMVDNIIGYEKAAFPNTTNSATLNGSFTYAETYGTYAGGGSRIYGDNNLYISAAQDYARYYAIGTSVSTAATSDGLGSTNMKNTVVLPAGAPVDGMRNPQLTAAPAVVAPQTYAAITPKLNFGNPSSAITCLAAHVGAGSSFPPATDPCPAGGY
jgi:hypothetical protein